MFQTPAERESVGKVTSNNERCGWEWIGRWGWFERALLGEELRSSTGGHVCTGTRVNKKAQEKRRGNRESMRHLLCLCQGDIHAWVLLSLTGRHQRSRTIPLSQGSCFLLTALRLVYIGTREITSYFAVKKLEYNHSRKTNVSVHTFAFSSKMSAPTWTLFLMFISNETQK